VEAKALEAVVVTEGMEVEMEVMAAVAKAFIQNVYKGASYTLQYCR
jgi:hypothetical protein